MSPRRTQLSAISIFGLGLTVAAATWVEGVRRGALGDGRLALQAIDVRTADAAAWRCAAGVGPVRAARLAEASRLGWLRGPADFESVWGIGPDTADSLRAVTTWGGTP